MSAIRMNVTLPEDIAETLKELAGPRGQSSFVAESIRYYAKRIKRQRLKKELEEGYKATAQEDRELNAVFDSALMDGLEDDN